MNTGTKLKRIVGRLLALGVLTPRDAPLIARQQGPARQPQPTAPDPARFRAKACPA